MTLFLCCVFSPPLQFSSVQATEQKRLFLDKDGDLKVSNAWFQHGD